MRNIYMLPTPEQAAKDLTNAINQIVGKLTKYLPEFGYTVVEDKAQADFIVGHAGQTDGQTPVDVAVLHGLYPTHEYPEPAWTWAANAHVIKNIKDARAVTVPSEWVADILRRDMHINPDILGWAIEPEEWQPGDNQGYVLWNKTRAEGVCDPAPVNALAALNPDIQFVTTFGQSAPNVQVIGRQPYDKMREYIRHAAVYLATTKETFGIGTLEAMACGVPVLGYDWGGTGDIIRDLETGYLVRPKHIPALHEGLAHCLAHRELLGAAARKTAEQYTWDKVAARLAAILDRLAVPRTGPKVSIVVLSHNYGHYLPDALRSVQAQKTDFEIEVVGVDNGSTDNTAEVFQAFGVTLIQRENDGPANGRNAGIAAAHGEYILPLDADDQLGSDRFIQTLADALDRDRTLGIAYTGLLPIDDRNAILNISGWPNGYDFEQQIQRHNQVPTCCLFRRVAWERAGGYRRRFEPAEDAELWLRMGALGFRGAQIVKEGWFIYRMHNQSLSASVRRAPHLEPNWLLYHPWIKTKARPFANVGNPEQHSFAVRNYDQPEVSIIIPVGKGHERIVCEALDSVEGQSVWNWECIVVNDTGAPLSLTAYPWAKVIDTLQSGRGAGVARNAGLVAARGDFVTFLDADDMLDPEFLARTLDTYRRTGRYVYTDWFSVTTDGRLERHEAPQYDLQTVFNRSSIHSVNVLLPRAWALAIGGFDETMPAWEDVDLFMKLPTYGYCGVRVPEPLFIYRYQQGQRREYGETIKDELKALLANRYGTYMKGEKMCSCAEPKRKKPAAMPETAAGTPVNALHGAMVRILYDGPAVGSAKHPVTGPATGTVYGRRARGDTFMVWEADLRASSNFHIYTEFEVPEVAQ